MFLLDDDETAVPDGRLLVKAGSASAHAQGWVRRVLQDHVLPDLAGVIWSYTTFGLQANHACYALAPATEENGLFSTHSSTTLAYDALESKLWNVDNLEVCYQLDCTDLQAHRWQKLVGHSQRPSSLHSFGWIHFQVRDSCGWARTERPITGESLVWYLAPPSEIKESKWSDPLPLKVQAKDTLTRELVSGDRHHSRLCLLLRADTAQPQPNRERRRSTRNYAYRLVVLKHVANSTQHENIDLVFTEGSRIDQMYPGFTNDTLLFWMRDQRLVLFDLITRVPAVVWSFVDDLKLGTNICGLKYGAACVDLRGNLLYVYKPKADFCCESLLAIRVYWRSTSTNLELVDTFIVDTAQSGLSSGDLACRYDEALSTGPILGTILTAPLVLNNSRALFY